MINLRYHIVSITAVFLAVGIGVALGSTFLDGATVGVLDRNIRSAEARIRETNAENNRLSDELEDAKARDAGLIELGSERLLGDELVDQRVLVVAGPGVDDDQLGAVRSVIAQSGADLRGTLVLSDRMAFDTQEVDDGLATDLGLEDPSVAELQAATSEQLVAALAAAGAPAEEIPDAEEGSGSPDGTSTTTTTPVTTTTTPVSTTATPSITTTTTASSDAPPDGAAELTEQPAVIDAMVQHGYAELVPGPGHESTDPVLDEVGYRYVFVGAPDASAADNDVLLALLPETAGTDAIPTVVVTSTQDAPAPDEALTPTIVTVVRSSEPLAQRYTTVDDIETFSGMTAMVFSLADLGTVSAGHYGQADGASAVLPPVP